MLMQLATLQIGGKSSQKKKSEGTYIVKSCVPPHCDLPAHHQNTKMYQPISLLSFRGPILLKSPYFLMRGSAKPFAIVNESPFRNRMHPLHARTIARFQARQTKLNLYIVVSTATHKSNCVRDRIRRRLNEATRLALADFGYRLDGSPIHVQNRMKEGARMWMVGTLVYHPEYKVVSTPWEELMAEVKKGIEKFMILKERDAKTAEMEMEAMLEARDARRATDDGQRDPEASAVERISALKVRDEQERNARPGATGDRRGGMGNRRGGAGSGLQWRPPQGPHGRRGPSQYQQSTPQYQRERQPSYQRESQPPYQQQRQPSYRKAPTRQEKPQKSDATEYRKAPTRQAKPQKSDVTEMAPRQRDGPQVRRVGSTPSWMSRGGVV